MLQYEDISKRVVKLSKSKRAYAAKKQKIAAMSEEERQVYFADLSAKQKIYNAKQRHKVKQSEMDEVVERILKHNPKIMCLRYKERFLQRLNVSQIRRAIEEDKELDMKLASMIQQSKEIELGLTNGYFKTKE